LWRRLGIVSGTRRRGFQAPRDRRQKRIASGFSGSSAEARRSSQIDDEHREVEAFVAAGAIDGVRHSIDEQQTIGQPGNAGPSPSLR
jgi:hypothetical protein